MGRENQFSPFSVKTLKILTSCKMLTKSQFPNFQCIFCVEIQCSLVRLFHFQALFPPASSSNVLKIAEIPSLIQIILPQHLIDKIQQKTLQGCHPVFSHFTQELPISSCHSIKSCYYFYFQSLLQNKVNFKFPEKVFYPATFCLQRNAHVNNLICNPFNPPTPTAFLLFFGKSVY